MIALTAQSYINGISAWLIVIIGYMFWIIFMLKYFKQKKPLLPYVSLLALCLGTFYLAPGITFIKVAFGGENLNETVYFLMSYILNPVGTLIVVYLGFSIFQPKYKKYASYFYMVLLVVYWILMFGWPQDAYEIVPGEEILDENLTGVIRYLTTFNILTILVLITSGFLRLAFKMKKKGGTNAEVHKLFLIGIGWLLFSIASITDAIAPASLIYIVLVGRIIMATSCFMIFEGFMPPKEE